MNNIFHIDVVLFSINLGYIYQISVGLLQVIYTLKNPDTKYLYGKGNFAEISERIRRARAVTAVFVSVDMLTSVQLATMQKKWKVPVYDRSVCVWRW